MVLSTNRKANKLNLTDARLDKKRVQIADILHCITNDGDGDVYADDVIETLRVLKLSDKFANKVSTALDDVAEARRAISAFRTDARHAAWLYGETGRMSPDVVESIIEQYEDRVTKGINLLIGLSRSFGA